MAGPYIILLPLFPIFSFPTHFRRIHYFSCRPIYSTTLQDPRTISGVASSRKFNSYAYTRKLLIRKTLGDDPTHHKINCGYIVCSEYTNTSLQLRHIRSRHRSLPASQEEETHQLDQKATNTPFTIGTGNYSCFKKTAGSI